MKILVSLALMAAMVLSGCSAISGEGTTVSSTSNSPLSAIVVAPAPPASDTTLAYQPPPLTAPPDFVKITAQLVFGDSQPGTNLPLGSTVYHWKNNITEAIGPDNTVIFICRDAEATQMPTPGAGVQPVTRIIGVPDGALISTDKDNPNITKIYDGNKLIGTIVKKPGDFPYTPTQQKNTSQQYIATRINADGSTSDITSHVDWFSFDTAIATVSADGLVTAVADGHTKINATMNGVTSFAVELTVNSLVSISVSPWSGIGFPSTLTVLPLGLTHPLFATGFYSDGSSVDINKEVTWISSNPSVATIDSTGTITPVAAGTDTITAEIEGMTSTPITFDVISPVSVEIIGATTNMTIGSTWYFQTNATYNDGSAMSLYQPTWISSNTAVATFTPDGILTAHAEGTTTITVSENGIVSKPVIVTVSR